MILVVDRGPALPYNLGAASGCILVRKSRLRRNRRYYGRRSTRVVVLRGSGTWGDHVFLRATTRVLRQP